MKISAKLSDARAKELGVSNAPISVECNIPATLAEKVKLYGEDVVNSAAEGALVINVQALMRRMMQPKLDKDGKVTAPASNHAAIQKAVSEWKPDVKSVVRQSAFEKATSALGKLTPEEKAALLKQLQSQK